MTKEELKKLGGIIHQTLKDITLRNIGENRLSGNAGEAWRLFDVIQTEFNRYIDVLEPLCNVDRTRDTYTYVYAWLRGRERYATGFNETAEMLSRASDIIFPKPTCPHCGKEVE